ncbi:hypothetical protein M758_2G105800 [Ceratodon purpureus]|nr:hypothetical protein M758_2G105800 [Ceratodon purpureus]KAG0626145.1 hypothetical protein M758_2G105800 [Ceratodon purpureus]
MLELAASYTASKKYGKGVPCLLPVFLELKPEHAKSFEKQLEWKSTWEEWRRNEIMSDRPEPRTNRVEPTVWREALMKLLDTRGPVYKPHENRYKSALFAENVARIIAGKLDELSKTKVSYKAVNRRDSASMEHLSKDFIRMTAYANSPHFDQMEDASTSGETHMEFETTDSGLKLSEREGNVAEREGNVEERERKVTEREISINKRQRLVEVRETNVGGRERKVKARETFVDERERNVLVRELERKENQGCTDLNGERLRSEFHVWGQCTICRSQPSGGPYGDRLICPGPPPRPLPPFPDYSSLRDRSPHRGGPYPSPNSTSNLSF